MAPTGARPINTKPQSNYYVVGFVGGSSTYSLSPRREREHCLPSPFWERVAKGRVRASVATLLAVWHSF